MKKFVCFTAIIVLLVSILASCERLDDGPITDTELFDGKTPKHLYGESINKYKKHKEEGVPYEIAAYWSSHNDASSNISLKVTYNGERIKYNVTVSENNKSYTEEIIFCDGVIYFIDKYQKNHCYDTEKSHVEKYINEFSHLADITPALPDNIPNSWFDDLKFMPSEDGKYYIVTAESKKEKQHPLYQDFYKSDVICKLSFRESGVLEKIELNNVFVNNTKSDLILTFSWDEIESIDKPSNYEEYEYKGCFDPNKGHILGNDYKTPEEKPVDPPQPDEETEEHVHIPGKKVIENKIEPTCKNSGSYYEVVYCTDETCGAEISREQKIENAKGHIPNENLITTTVKNLQDVSVCEKQEFYATTCIECGEAYFILSDAIGHNYEKWEVLVEPTEDETGLAVFQCSRCDSYSDEVILPPLSSDEYAVKNKYQCSTHILYRFIIDGTEYEINHTTLSEIGHDEIPEDKDDWVVLDLDENYGLFYAYYCRQCRYWICIQPVNHSYTLSNIIVYPTETTPGLVEITCSYKFHTCNVEIPPLTDKNYSTKQEGCTRYYIYKYTQEECDVEIVFPENGIYTHGNVPSKDECVVVEGEYLIYYLYYCKDCNNWINAYTEINTKRGES